jgi:hypothetical protein
MDGTFDSAPSPFGQLFTVHVFFGDKQLPAVFVLMESKSAQLYNDVFSELILQAAMKGVTLRPTTVVSDFETGLLTSVKQVFSGRQAPWVLLPLLPSSNQKLGASLSP